MIPLLLIFAPLVLWIIAYGIAERWPRSTAAAFAAFALLAVWATIAVSREWPQASRIVWRGIESVGKSKLVIGGSWERTGAGWPRGEFSAPQLTFDPVGAARVKLTVAEGGAFVLDLEGKKPRVLNGFEVPRGYEGRVDPSDPLLLRHVVVGRWRPLSELQFVEPDRAGGKGRLVATAMIPSPSGPFAVHSLAELIGRLTVKVPEEDMPRLVALRSWAEKICVLVEKGGSLWFVDDRLVKVTEIAVPCRLQVCWPGRSRLTAKLEGTRDEGLRFQFEYPWRRSSPLPPGIDAGVDMAIAAEARPGDTAFLLPVGGLAQGMRGIRQLSLDADGRPVFGAKKTPAVWKDLVPPEFRPKPSVISPVQREIDQELVGSGERGSAESVGVRSSYRFALATVSDLPAPAYLLLPGVLAWGALVWGLRLAYPRMLGMERRRWALFGLALCSWCFLCLRLLLALRYTLETALLDNHAIDGVVAGFVGLAVVPGAILLAGRLAHGDWSNDLALRRKERNQVIYYAVFLLGIAILEVWVTGALWPLMTARGTVVVALALGLLLIVLLPPIWLDQRSLLPADDRAPGRFRSSRAEGGKRSTAQGLGESIAGRLRLRALLEVTWSRLSDSASGADVFRQGFGLWFGFGLLVIALLGTWYAVALPFLQRDLWSIWVLVPLLGGILVAGLFLVRPIWFIFAFACIGTFCVLPLLASLSGGYLGQAIREVGVGLLAFWLPAWFWLVGKEHFSVKGWSPHSLWTAVGLACLLTVILPLFGLPVATRDPGSFYAGLAVFLPLGSLLLTGRPRRFGSAMLVGIIVTFLCIKFLLPHMPYGRLDDARLRLAGLGEGPKLVERFFFSEGLPVANRGSFQAEKIRNVVQHVWENKAIAQAGGWFGLGFGRSPARGSHVGQETVQTDSVYSFYVVAESGFLGGLALLLAACAPLTIIGIATRWRFDALAAFAALIAAAFALEAATQAAMNLGALAFTGRNLPWLAVHSLTDLTRWMILFALAAAALLRSSIDEPSRNP